MKYLNSCCYVLNFFFCRNHIIVIGWCDLKDIIIYVCVLRMNWTIVFAACLIYMDVIFILFFIFIGSLVPFLMPFISVLEVNLQKRKGFRMLFAPLYFDVYNIEIQHQIYFNVGVYVKLFTPSNVKTKMVLYFVRCWQCRLENWLSDLLNHLERK